MSGHTALTKPSDSRVGRVNNFSRRRPLLFALSTLVAWMALASTGVILIATLTRNPITDPLPQSAGALIATLALITVMGWLGWIQQSGIGRLGDGWAWVSHFAPVNHSHTDVRPCILQFHHMGVGNSQHVLPDPEYTVQTSTRSGQRRNPLSGLPALLARACLGDHQKRHTQECSHKRSGFWWTTSALSSRGS